MILEIKMETTFRRNKDVIFRESGDEVFIVVPSSGMGMKEEALFTLTGTARAIWQLLDGNTSVQQIIRSIVHDYDVSENVARQDVTEFLEELAVSGMLVS